ncbi:MAG TPA: zinc ABC transporter substrate-binding protein [Dehalococcoidia bacterium]|nr:zinc ABC transporter substrate-binding protein [Dehalococcoidia bacterium]
MLVMFFLAACGDQVQSTPSPESGKKIQVVATTALLADMVENVGGELVEVRSLVPPGADVHSFQSTPEDSIAINRAQVIVLNGFGLDEFLAPVLDSAGKENSTQVVAASGLIQGEDDPHLWQNPAFAISYVERIRDGLVAAYPGRESQFDANAQVYIGRLRELDLELNRILGQVEPELRHVITYHDAFGHLAERYGWEASAFVASDADEVSPQAVVEILDRLDQEGITAIFMGPQFGSDVVRRAAEDSGIAVGTLYSGVGENEATSYIDMMRLNAETLAEHLR